MFELILSQLPQSRRPPLLRMLNVLLAAMMNIISSQNCPVSSIIKDVLVSSMWPAATCQCLQFGPEERQSGLFIEGLLQSMEEQPLLGGDIDERGARCFSKPNSRAAAYVRGPQNQAGAR